MSNQFQFIPICNPFFFSQQFTISATPYSAYCNYFNRNSAQFKPGTLHPLRPGPNAWPPLSRLSDVRQCLSFHTPSSNQDGSPRALDGGSTGRSIFQNIGSSTARHALHYDAPISMPLLWIYVLIQGRGTVEQIRKTEAEQIAGRGLRQFDRRG